MKKILKWASIFIIVIVILIIIFINIKQKNEYTKNIYYMDTYIYIKIYSNDKNKAINALNEVEAIYKDYHQLTDRYNHYDGIVNVYDIYHNEIENQNLTIDQKLYDILTYADNWHQAYDRFNIEIGNVIDVWKKYRDSENGIPTFEELSDANNIVKLVLLGNNTILNNHPNLDLGSISKGYTTELAGKYLESIGIEEYLINAGGNVKVGKSYQKDNYRIGIQSPISQKDLLTIVKGNNISVITSGGYERNYEYNGKTYHHIIDPSTLYPSDYMKGVTVITDDSALGDALSTILFLMSVEEGQEFIKNYDAQALWYTNDNQIVRSENFASYE